jgi:hypothetical protein
MHGLNTHIAEHQDITRPKTKYKYKNKTLSSSPPVKPNQQIEYACPQYYRKTCNNQNFRERTGTEYVIFDDAVSFGHKTYGHQA